MLFNTPEDIKKDIKNRISNYLKESISQNIGIDINNIISLLRNYLNELKNIGEISNWDADIEKDKNTILVIIYKSNGTNPNIKVGMHYFVIDLFLELRKLKIIKIQERDNKKKNIKNFFI